MPVSTDAALREVARRLHLVLTDAQFDALSGYLALLQRWNAVYNLSAIKTLAQSLSHHIADCLAVIAPLGAKLADTPNLRLLDVGSGAGLPGIVIAIARPDIRVTCIDAVGKKMAFVRQAGAELRIANLLAVHGRVESLPSKNFDVVASRAFADLGRFVSLTEHLVAPHGIWMAMRGRAPVSEEVLLPMPATVFHVEPLAVPDLDADRCIVWLHRAPTE